MWDCPIALDAHALGKALGKTVERKVGTIAAQIQTLWRYFEFAGFLELPTNCTEGASWESCRGKGSSSYRN